MQSMLPDSRQKYNTGLKQNKKKHLLLLLLQK
jgi:hypothetical protein